MVVGAFPIFKLGALLLKQLSKPIANYAKHQAKSSPFFRKYVCMPPAQFYNWCEIRMRMWILNLGKPVNIPPMNEQMAIELGANLLGEGILFITASGILLLEYNRQAVSTEKKEQARLDEMIDLKMQLEEQRTQIRELYRKVYDLDGRVIQLPKAPWTKTQEHNPNIEMAKATLNKSNNVESRTPQPVVNDQSIINEAISYIQHTVYGRSPQKSRMYEI